MAWKNLLIKKKNKQIIFVCKPFIKTTKLVYLLIALNTLKYNEREV